SFIEQQWRLGKTTQNYFWITANPEIWSVDNIKDGSTASYTTRNEKGNRRVDPAAYNKAKSGDLVIFYESGSSNKVIGRGQIEQGIHQDGESNDVVSFSFTEKLDPISWDELSSHPSLQESAVVRRGNRGSLL